MNLSLSKPHLQAELQSQLPVQYMRVQSFVLYKPVQEFHHSQQIPFPHSLFAKDGERLNCFQTPDELAARPGLKIFLDQLMLEEMYNQL